MKKIFTLFAAALCAAGMLANSYGIAVNGSMYYAGAENPTPADPSFQEFMVLGLSLNANDQLQLWDPSANDGAGAGWAVDLDGASTSFITRDGDHYVCSTAGCYDFYIKLKYQEDQLYIGNGNCGSPTGVEIGSNPGGQGGQGGQGGNQGGSSDDAYWYWKGFVDGVDLNNEIEGGLFDGGISEITVAEVGYIFVVYQVHGVPGIQYMTSAYTEATHATMLTTGTEKMMIPAGTHTLYLYDNGDGTVELSREALSGKTLVDGGKSAVEEVTTDSPIRKMIVNGQVVIEKNGVRYNLLGAQVQ